MNNSQKISGFLFGLLSSASFGLIPLFTVPVMREGLTFQSILAYRFGIATLFLLLLLLKDRQSLRITWGEAARLALLALLYAASALFLFWGYTYMSSGIATSIHFMYPVMTAIVMMLFFGEHATLRTFVAIALATAGVFVLSGDSGAATSVSSLSIVGLVIVLISALAYALYLVTVNQLKVRHLNTRKLTFFVFLFGTFYFLLFALFTTGTIQPLPSPLSAVNLFLLALIPTIISNLALIQAVQRIGSTLTSVMGALEPLTAVCVGILFLGEPFSMAIASGILLIIVAVTLLVLKK